MANHSSSTNRWARRLALLVLAVHVNAGAAVATSEDLDQDTDSGDAAPRSAAQASPIPPAATVGVPQNKTIELLLQLQDQPPPASEKERDPRKPSGGKANGVVSAAASAPKAGLPSTPNEPNPLLPLKEAILGAAARPVDSSTQERVESIESRDRGDARFTGTPGGASPAGARSSGPRESLLSHPVIRYIRENRGLVLGGSFTLLAAVWLTANFSLRSRRD